MKREIEFASHTANLSAVRGMVRDFVTSLCLTGSEIEMIVLGVDEACANIIRHVYKKEETRLIGLSCERLDGGVRFRLRDYGDHCSTPGDWCGRELERVQPGGLGLHLIRSAFDDVDYRPQPHGMELVLTKHCKPAAAPGP